MSCQKSLYVKFQHGLDQKDSLGQLVHRNPLFVVDKDVAEQVSYGLGYMLDSNFPVVFSIIFLVFFTKWCFRGQKEVEDTT